MVSSMYSNGILRPKLPPRLMAFEEARTREREIVTFLVHQPQYLDALASYSLTSADFVHSTVACKQPTSVMDRTGRRFERLADVVVEHCELIEAIDLFLRGRGRIQSLGAAIDLLFSNKLATARAAFDQRQLQARWEGAKRLAEEMLRSQPVPAEDFFDSLESMCRANGKKVSKYVRYGARAESDAGDEPAFDSDSADVENYRPAPKLAARQHPHRERVEETQETLEQQRATRADVLEFDPGALDPSASKAQSSVASMMPPETAAVPAADFAPRRSAMQPRRTFDPPPVRTSAPGRASQFQSQPSSSQFTARQPSAPSPSPVVRAEAFPEGGEGGPQRWPWSLERSGFEREDLRLKTGLRNDGEFRLKAGLPNTELRNRSLAPRVKVVMPAGQSAPQSEARVSSAQPATASVRSPLRLPPDFMEAPRQPENWPSCVVSSSVQPLSSFTGQMSAQLFAERRVLIPAPCHPLDTALGGGFVCGQVYSVSADSELAADDFLSECADFAAMNGVPAVLLSSRLTREQSWVRGIARLGKIESRVIEKRSWLSEQNGQSERMKLQIARAVEKYNRLADRVSLIECQAGITLSQVQQIVTEVRKFHQLDDAKPLLIAIDSMPRVDEGGADPAVTLKQLARQSSAAVLVAGTKGHGGDVSEFAHQLFSKRPGSIAADYSLQIEVEAAGGAAELERGFEDQPSALFKVRQLRKYFPPDPDGTERSTLALVTVTEQGQVSRQTVVTMYQQAFHNFAGIEIISRGVNR